MLDIWEEKLIEYAEIISIYRKEFTEKIKERIVPIHNKITKEREKIKIKYFSDFIDKEEFAKKLRNNRKIDIAKGFTGIRNT